MPDNQPAPETVRATATLKIGDRPVRLQLDVPTGPVRQRIMLPLYQQVTNLVVGVAEQRVAEQGKEISCRAGCGACCRQVVPIAPSEARQLRELVEALPEPRRTEVRRRFAEAVDRLAAGGLLEELRHTPQIPPGRSGPLGLEYFRLGI